jgi:hypothetical protein
MCPVDPVGSAGPLVFLQIYGRYIRRRIRRSIVLSLCLSGPKPKCRGYGHTDRDPDPYHTPFDTTEAPFLRARDNHRYNTFHKKPPLYIAFRDLTIRIVCGSRCAHVLYKNKNHMQLKVLPYT